MNDALHLKYLTVGPGDLSWGMAVSSVGFQEVGPGEPYPPGNHPLRYLFSMEKGRVLDDYQLIYVTRGSGRFRSASLQYPLPVVQGSLFLLFPGEWHSYSPSIETGWKEYWIGFQGKIADDWLENRFLHMQKAVFDIGLRSDVTLLNCIKKPLIQQVRSRPAFSRGFRAL